MKPRLFSFLIVLLLSTTLVFSQKAEKIITVSNFSKTDIIKNYGISSEKINVIFNGGNDAFKSLNTNQKKVFIENATRVENKPGRAVIFDVDEYHLPQEFSGNTHPRFIYGGLLIRSDSLDLIEKLEVPNAKTGRAVIGLK